MGTNGTVVVEPKSIRLMAGETVVVVIHNEELWWRIAAEQRTDQRPVAGVPTDGSPSERGPEVVRRRRKGAKRTRASAGGPLAVFRRMVEEGFFETPRTGREAQRHAADNFRTQIATNNVHAKLGDLVTTGVLHRAKGEGGLYRYSVAHTAPAPGAHAQGTKVANQTRKVRRSGPTATAQVRTSGARLGALSLLKQQAAMDYFAQSRLCGEVCDHLKHSLGRALPRRDVAKALLRMVRSGQLKRRQREDGEYEYSGV